MARPNFDFYNISFKRKGSGHWVFMQGEIINNSDKDYTSAVFKLSVFDKNLLMWSGPLKVRNFRRRQVRSFELLMEGFNYRSIPSVSRYDIFFESGY